MKFISLIIATLASFGAHAELSQYHGKTYSVENITACEAEYQEIVLGLETERKFKVLDGGCVSLGEKFIQLKFSYSHPITSRIERFERVFDSNETCDSQVLGAKQVFENSGNHYIASYCRGKRISVDYIDLGASVIRELRDHYNFSDDNQCETFLKGLTNELGKTSINVMFGNCVEYQTYSGERLFTPELNISAHFSNSVEFLKGKTLDEGESCFENAIELQDTFETNGIKLPYTFCAGAKEKYEVIVYIEKMMGPKVRTFKGQAYADKAECSYQLERAVGTLGGIGKNSLYAFCSKSYGERYTPVIYYTEK